MPTVHNPQGFSVIANEAGADYTVPDVSNRILYLFARNYEGNSVPQLTVTFNGLELSRVAFAERRESGFCEVHRLVNPPVGQFSMAATNPGDTSGVTLVALVVSGVSQVSPHEAGVVIQQLITTTELRTTVNTGDSGLALVMYGEQNIPTAPFGGATAITGVTLEAVGDYLNSHQVAVVSRSGSGEIELGLDAPNANGQIQGIGFTVLSAAPAGPTITTYERAENRIYDWLLRPGESVTRSTAPLSLILLSEIRADEVDEIEEENGYPEGGFEIAYGAPTNGAGANTTAVSFSSLTDNVEAVGSAIVSANGLVLFVDNWNETRSVTPSDEISIGASEVDISILRNGS